MEPTFNGAWRTRALAGEPAAVRLLTDAALGPLYTFCLYRVGRDRHLCEEVVQETLLRAVLDLAAYEPARSAGNIFPWLAGLARNEVRRALARRRRECPGQDPASLETLWDQIDRELLDVYAQLGSDPFDDDLLRRDETRQMVNATPHCPGRSGGRSRRGSGSRGSHRCGSGRWNTSGGEGPPERPASVARQCESR